MNIESKITNLINANLNLIKIDIINDSFKHLHHKKDTQGGHFKVLIVSDDFKGISLINRHKLIYRILGKLMQSEIHALSMQTLTKEEYKTKIK